MIAIIHLDGIAALNGEAAAMSASIQVRADFAMLGLIEYTYCKVHLDPTVHLSWLGFDLDLAGSVISQYWKYSLLELHTVFIKYPCVLGLHPCY